MRPEYIFSKLSFKFKRVTRNTTFGGIKNDRRFGSTLANQSFVPRTIKLWNEKLPRDLRKVVSIIEFKSKLKSWVMTNVNN